MQRPHIVILGAGFGGVYVGKKLVPAVKRGEVDVTIVNRTNNFLFTPLLHEVATGALNPRTVAEPLREIFVRSNVRIIQGAVDSIDLAARKIAIKTEGEPVSLAYDQVVIATGAETNYYGIPGAAEHALSLKTLPEAARIRNRIIGAFEQAVVTDDPVRRRELLSFVVVGGGPTGVETAAELAEFVEGIVHRYYGKTHCRTGDPRHCAPEEPSVTLVHAGKELLEQFAPGLRRAALKALQAKKVAVRVQTSVASVTEEGIATASGEKIPGSIVIWSAGVKASIPRFAGAAPTLSGGRLAVDSYFRLLGVSGAFAMGDAAAYVDPHSPPGSKPVPQLAQVAQAEADTVAANALAAARGGDLAEFHFHSKGSMVSVGQWFAIGEIYSMHIAGWFAWWMWRTVYLFKFASWKKRVRIGIEWFLQMFFPRDITKIS